MLKAVTVYFLNGDKNTFPFNRIYVIFLCSPYVYLCVISVERDHKVISLFLCLWAIVVCLCCTCSTVDWLNPKNLVLKIKKKIRSFVAYAIVSMGQSSQNKGRENNNLINVYRINNSTPSANVKENLKWKTTRGIQFYVLLMFKVKRTKHKLHL